MQVMTEAELWDVVSLMHWRTELPIEVTPYRFQDGARVVDVVNGSYRQTVIVAED